MTAADPEYPERFFRLEQAPAVVWVRGRLEPAARRVALVGARRATRGGRAFARDLAAELAREGVEVWSGLARGVDAAAHEGALEAGRTVAVLGAGLDVVYPPEHAGLLERVCARGAALSEFEPGTQPLPYHFPRRNRLMVAVADAVLVVEAGERSGALTTVNWALAMQVPALVAPGDPTAPSCRGSNQLLRAGATPLLDASDVLAAMGWGSACGRCGTGASDDPAPESLPEGGEGPEREWLLRALRREPQHVDELANGGSSAGAVQAELVRLELEGRVEALGGGYYALARRGPRGPG
ncbi:MAG: DNA-protecting protein DprA [Candidatus Eisenbacteria bacterium]|nr:DNA-protecting protein DprA [Candidatus Eisenbacteria bacterium]